MFSYLHKVHYPGNEQELKVSSNNHFESNQKVNQNVYTGKITWPHIDRTQSLKSNSIFKDSFTRRFGHVTRPAPWWCFFSNKIYKSIWGKIILLHKINNKQCQNITLGPNIFINFSKKLYIYCHVTCPVIALLHVVTRCYTLLHVVTRCYTLLHVVTRCYALLRVFTRFYCIFSPIWLTIIIVRI